MSEVNFFVVDSFQTHQFGIPCVFAVFASQREANQIFFFHQIILTIQEQSVSLAAQVHWFASANPETFSDSPKSCSPEYHRPCDAQVAVSSKTFHLLHSLGIFNYFRTIGRSAWAKIVCISYITSSKVALYWANSLFWMNLLWCSLKWSPWCLHLSPKSGSQLLCLTARRTPFSNRSLGMRESQRMRLGPLHKDYFLRCP